MNRWNNNNNKIIIIDNRSGWQLVPSKVQQVQFRWTRLWEIRAWAQKFVNSGESGKLGESGNPCKLQNGFFTCSNLNYFTFGKLLPNPCVYAQFFTIEGPFDYSPLEKSQLRMANNNLYQSVQNIMQMPSPLLNSPMLNSPSGGSSTFIADSPPNQQHTNKRTNSQQRRTTGTSSFSNSNPSNTRAVSSCSNSDPNVTPSGSPALPLGEGNITLCIFCTLCLWSLKN